MRILIKSTSGAHEPQIVCKGELHELLKKNADKEGNLQREIIIYQDVFFEKLEKAPDPYTDGIPWVLSTYSVDTDLERIDPKGWNLKEYKKNPVVLWSHEWWTPAIGMMLSTRVKDEKLIGKVVFDPKEVDPFSCMIAEKVVRGTVRAGSVGFKSDRIEIVEEDDKKEAAYLIHRKQTLFEFSIANLGANKDALAESRSDQSGDNKLDEEAVKAMVRPIIDDALAEFGNRTYIEELLKTPRPGGRKTSGNLSKLFEKKT